MLNKLHKNFSHGNQTIEFNLIFVCVQAISGVSRVCMFMFNISAASKAETDTQKQGNGRPVETKNTPDLLLMFWLFCLC